MKLSDIVSPDTRLFVKSEFGPAGNHWPALSFSSHKVAADFRSIYRPGVDFVVYIGTGDPESTEMPEHRQRLLSVVSVEPRAPISTKDLVPTDVWDRTVQKHGLRWEWSLPLVGAYDVIGFPRAHDTIPELYRSLGTLQNLGRCVEAHGPEYDRLASLDIVEVPLALSQRAQSVLNLNTDNQASGCRSHATGRLPLFAEKYLRPQHMPHCRIGMAVGFEPRVRVLDVSRLYAAALDDEVDDLVVDPFVERVGDHPERERYARPEQDPVRGIDGYPSRLFSALVVSRVIVSPHDRDEPRTDILVHEFSCTQHELVVLNIAPALELLFLLIRSTA